MREGAGESASNLAAELARRPDAIVVLAALHAHNGVATSSELRRTRPKPFPPAADMRWLATVGLVYRDAPAGTWDTADEPGAVYRLTAPGRSLAASMAALADGFAKHDRPFRPR